MDFRYWAQTDYDVIYPMEVHQCNNSQYRACRTKLQVVSTVCNNDDVIIVEVTMTRQKIYNC